MMKFKSSSARTKFKSKLRARVKFDACAAFSQAARQNVSAERMSQRIASAALHTGSKFKLLKNSGEAKFKISPPKRKRIKAPRSAPLGRFEAPPAYLACFFALRNRPK